MRTKHLFIFVAKGMEGSAEQRRVDPGAAKHNPPSYSSLGGKITLAREPPIFKAYLYIKNFDSK